MDSIIQSELAEWLGVLGFPPIGYLLARMLYDHRKKERLAMADKVYKRNRYRMQQAKDQFADKLGLDPADPRIEIEAGDGTPFLIEHPMFRSKETKAALRDVDDNDAEGIAAACLGDQYDDFIEHGGDPEDLQFVFLEIQKDITAVQAGKRRPTRS